MKQKNTKNKSKKKTSIAIKKNRRVYLDYAATTPVRPEVYQFIKPFTIKNFGNPSSIYLEGRIAKQALEQAREKIAKILNCQTHEIIFTNGGTESINLAIFGVARAYKKFFKKPRIITSQIEHPAVLESVKKLEKEGFEIKYVSTNKFGEVNLQELKKYLNNQTILISIMYANNEIGTIQPIKKISKIIKNFRQKKYLPFFHTDACQAANYLDLNIKQLGIDFMTLNGGKIYAPKASGILYKKSGLSIDPIIFGGGQEKNLRSGTENLTSWMGIAKALELTQKEKNSEIKKIKQLRDYFQKNILKIPKVILNGHPQKRLPNNLNIIISDIEGEALILELDKAGIAASTGSACHSHSLEPSHVLKSLGLSREKIHGSLRFTLGKYTTKKEIDYVIKVLPKIIQKLRNLSAINFTEKN
jgi:cysteine desulfurase